MYIKCFIMVGLFIASQNVNAQFYTIGKEIKGIRITSLDLKQVDVEMKEESVLLPSIASQKDSISTKLLHLPLDTIIINSKYGYRTDPFTQKKKYHKGIDLATSTSDVYAVMPGNIVKVGFEKKGLGNYVKVKSGNFEFIYGHLHTSIGEKGDFVAAGDRVGISGNTGRSTGEHLHFSIIFNGKHVDPLPIIEYIKNN